MNDKNLNLIGLIGVKKSGKDTVGNYLVENFEFTRYAFGDPVKEICKTLFDLSDEQLNDHKFKEKKDERWGVSPREMFQRIGTEFGQFELFKLFPELKKKIKYRELWVKLFEEWIQKNNDKKVVITDVRFKHEAKKIKDLGGINIKINRDIDKKDDHISEMELNQIPTDLIDFEIDNNYKLVDLYSQIDTIIYVPF
jgi:hypothetical protein